MSHKGFQHFSRQGSNMDGVTRVSTPMIGKINRRQNILGK